MIFNKRDRRNKNSKSGLVEGSQGVARSSKTGGFEARQDLHMICDDSSDESDSLPTNSNLTVFDTNESRSFFTKSSGISVSFGKHTTSASTTASQCQNSRDDSSWVRNDDRCSTSDSSKRKQRRDDSHSADDSVVTPQLHGCCSVSQSLPMLSGENWQSKKSTPVLISPAKKYLPSPDQPSTPAPFKTVNPASIDFLERAKGPIDLDDDDVSCCSSFDSDLGGRIIISDSKLMESSSPGSLRLTPDALQRHQRRAIHAGTKPQQKTTLPTQGYDSWKSRRDEQQWYKNQHQARDEELLDQTWKTQRQQRERAPTSTTIGSSEGSWNGRPRLASDSRKWSIGEISQNSWSSHLLGEDLEEEEEDINQHNGSRPRLASVVSRNVPLRTVVNSSTSSRRSLEGDDRRSRGSGGKSLATSDSSRQSTFGVSSRSRDSLSSSAVHGPRKVLPQCPTVPGPKTTTKASEEESGKVAKKRQNMLPPFGLRALFATDDEMADLSLAPLQCFEDLPAPPSQVKPQQHNVGGTPLFGVLRHLVPHKFVGTGNKKSTAQMAAVLLENERQRELQSRIAQRRADEEEKERIQQLKMAELERQRKREAQARMERKGKRRDEQHKTTIVKPDSSKIEVEQLVVYPEDHHDHTGQDVSTITTATSSMAPCVVCRAGPRTYIAMPCMHYSFCEACVSKMRLKNIEHCPVCSTQGVVFSRVLT